MVIYKITNLINGNRYIGQTVSKLKTRWSQHINYALKRKGLSVLALAIQKYGKENFEITIIVHCDSIEEMNHREQYYIRLFNTLAPNGYNLDSGGKNKRLHQDTKNKLSNALKGKKRKFSENHKLAISRALKEAKIRPILTKEQIRLRSLKLVGNGNGMFNKRHSEESKLKMSASKKGKNRGKNNPFFGKKHSEATKEKLRFARLKRIKEQLCNQ